MLQNGTSDIHIYMHADRGVHRIAFCGNQCRAVLALKILYSNNSATNNHKHIMLHISHLFASMYHNMQTLNKAALKSVIFGVECVYNCYVYKLLYWYGIDNWRIIF